MKKLLALILALMLALTCVSAFADTIYTKVAVDSEVLSGVLAGFGVPEDQMAMISPILAAVNALGVNVIPVEDGAQADLDFNGVQALSMGFLMDADGAKIASTLFPNYLVTVSYETIGQMMEQFSASMPAMGGEGSEGSSMDMNTMMETFGGYFQPWFEACAVAGKPGDPVPGEYEYEGYTFDTMVPVTVDMPAIMEATQTLIDSILADPAAMAMLQGMAQNSGETMEVSTFEENLKAGLNEWMAHMPETANAEVYANSDGSESFYMIAESSRPGDTEPSFYADMLFVDQAHMSMGYTDADATEARFELDGNNMSMYFAMGEMYMGLAMSFPEGQFLMDVYFMNEEKPLISITVITEAGGERTLSMDAAGKNVVTVEDIMSDESGEAIQGLIGDFMVNGMGTLIDVLTEQVPEIAGLMSMFTGTPN